jgi:AcrR family transcriptional regulator
MSSATLAPVREVNGHAAWVKRERIIAVAAELFAERGYENTSVEAIADRLGVSKPFFYLHFAAKTEVLVEICARGAVAMLGAVSGALDTPGSPVERLAGVARRVVVAALAQRRSLAILGREDKHLPPDDRLMIEEVFSAIEVQLTELLDGGVATAAFALRDARLGAAAIFGLLKSVSSWSPPSERTPEMAAEDVAQLVVAMACGGAHDGKFRASHGGEEREPAAEAAGTPSRRDWASLPPLRGDAENRRVVSLNGERRRLPGQVEYAV